MATLISKATGNLTGAVWANTDAAAFLDSETGTTVVTTSPVDSSTFTPGAVTVDGIAVKLSSRAASPAGTFTVTLRNSTGSVDIDSVTVNVADLAPDNNSMWHFFKFGSSHLLLAATLYTIRCSSSSGAQVTLFRDSTAANWSRVLRQTTGPAFPSAGDQLLIIGELTGAGTGNNFTVTIDDTANTVWGATSMLESVFVGKNGTLTSGVTASTAYTFAWSGVTMVAGGGVLNTGTIGTPMPSTSSLTMKMSVAVNVDTGLVIGPGGSWNCRGNALTTVWDKLAVDASVGATSLTTVNTTNWKNGDTVCIASTTRTASESESKALGADASGTSIGTIAALTNAHSGSNSSGYDTRAEIGNLTRNVKITGTSGTLQGYVLFNSGAIIDVQYAEFTLLGSATPNKRGIDFSVFVTGSVNFQYNSVHDNTVASSLGININANNGSNYTISNNVIYNCNTDGITLAVTNAVHTFDSNLIIKNTIGVCINSLDAGCTFTNNYVASGVTQGINLSESAVPLGTFSGNVSHSCTNTGIALSGMTVASASSCRVWRCGGSSGGVSLIPNASGYTDWTIDSFVVFGSSLAGIGLGGRGYGSILITNLTANAGVTLTQPVGLVLPITAAFGNVYLENCSFGATDAHATGDINIPTSPAGSSVYLRNCLLASTTEVANASNFYSNSFISSQKHDQTNGNYKTWMQYGTITIDTTIFNTASPSLRMTPNTAGQKLVSAPILRGFRIAVANGQTLTPTVFVRESVVGDGTAYNGTAPRLILRKNVAIGVAADIVIATYAGAAGTFRSVSGTTAAATDDGVMEFIIDCDGTTGWVNVDDFTVT